MSQPPYSTAIDHPGADTDLVDEIVLGLTGARKRLPSKLLYDATGSELFQRITELPEYYLTRTERRLLEACAADIAAAVPFEAGRTRALVEPAMRGKRSRCSMLPRVIFRPILQLTFPQACSTPSARVCR